MSATEIVRILDAPPERVWRAWTEPDELVRWWGKRGWTAQRDSLVLDVRPGGALRIVSVSDAGETMVNEGVWHEVSEFTRLAFGPPGGGAVSVVTFTDLGDGRTEMVFRTERELTERAVAGFHSGLDRLAEILNHVRSAP